MADEQAHPDWFRPPTTRERRMAAGLFLGFALFFAALFYLERGSGFRWVILALSVGSLVYAFSHAMALRGARRKE